MSVAVCSEHNDRQKKQHSQLVSNFPRVPYEAYTTGNNSERDSTTTGHKTTSNWQLVAHQLYLYLLAGSEVKEALFSQMPRKTFYYSSSI